MTLQNGVSNVRQRSPLAVMDENSPHRYYFDIVNGEHISFDEEGVELPDIHAVEEEAALALAALAKEFRSVVPAEPHRALAIEVRDDAGPVLRLQFVFETHRLQ